MKQAKSLPPISLQLYTIREAAKTDFRRVVEEAAEIGFRGVEPAGLYGMKPGDFRKLVEDLGMTVSSSHGPWAKPDNLQEVIDTAGELGVKLVSGGFGQDNFADLDAVKRTAETVSGMHEVLSAAGLTLFIHNHWWEFAEVAGDLAYHHFTRLCPEVSLEIDTYWAANFGKVDPVEIVARYAHRAPLLHIKDGPLVQEELQLPLGEGKMDIAGVVGASDPAVLQWLVVELDNYGGDMVSAVEKSFTYLVENGLGEGNV
jgi:sugar phosphate isomerase/epimerase